MFELEMEQDTSLIVASGAGISSTLQRSFSYELSDKKAKSNFLKSAAREVFEVEEKQLCTMMNFSVGSYLEVVIPSVIDWNNSKYNGVEEVIPGYDEKGKHVETIIRFRFKSERITVTCYYTTQRIKVEGKGYLDFVSSFLQPLLQHKIDQVLPGKIEKWNKEVIAYLSGKRKVVSRPMRSVKYKSINFSCTKCETPFASNAQMKKHMKMVHTSEIDLTPEKIESIPIVDNMSLLDISSEETNTFKQITLEETSPVMKLQEEKRKRSEHSEIKETNDENKTKQVTVTIEKNLNSNPVFKCGDCGYSSLIESDIETHKVMKHTKKTINLMKKPDVTSQVECIEELTCRSCEFEAEDPEIMKEHSNSKHPQSNEVELCCKICPFVSKEEKNLKAHLQTNHQSLVVDIVKMDRVKVEIECDQCDFKCRYNKQLQNHKKSKHIDLTEAQPGKCPFCDSQPKTVDKLAEHLRQMHGMTLTETQTSEPFPCSECNLEFTTFNLLQKHVAYYHTPKCRYCDYRARNNEELDIHLMEEHEDIIIVHSMAKQVTELKDALTKEETFKEELSNTLKSLFDNQEILDKKLSAILRKIEGPVSLPQTRTVSTCHTNNTSCPPTTDCSSPSTTSPPPPPSASTTPPLSVPTSSSVGKILLVGDSISGQLHTKTIEYATKAKVKKAKAYSSINENTSNDLKYAPKFPTKNFKDVIENELDKENFDVLLVQSGSTDITNLKTEGKNAHKHKYFKEQTITSAKNLFTSVTNAVKNHPSLQKIIVLKQTPRFDVTSTTTPGIKQELSKLYNETLDTLAASSDHKDKIMVGNHDLECSGGVLLARYKDSISGKFDGLHMFGPSGERAYTNSVMKVISSAQLVVSIPPKYYDEYDHQNCPQTRYQARQRNKIEEGKKGVNSGQNEYQYTVQTRNRFTTLGDYFPGNF